MGCVENVKRNFVFLGCVEGVERSFAFWVVLRSTFALFNGTRQKEQHVARDTQHVARYTQHVARDTQHVARTANN